MILEAPQAMSQKTAAAAPPHFTIVECPRDAWQGLPRVIPTARKVAYLRALIAAGFRHIDAVSFVSPRQVPQMADSEKVIEALISGAGATGVRESRSILPPPAPRRREGRGAGRSRAGAARAAGRRSAGKGAGRTGAGGARRASGKSSGAKVRRARSSAARAASRPPEGAPPQDATPEPLPADPQQPILEPDVTLTGIEIIGIVLNEKGLERALATPGVGTIGFPYSLSPTFQRQNANQSLDKARDLVVLMLERTQRAGRRLVVYLSMAFGNPYGDPYSPAAAGEAVDWLRGQGVCGVSLADTVGSAGPEDVKRLFAAVLPHARDMEVGLHLHTRPQEAEAKVRAAFEAGCRRLDGAIGGLGGCPFASDRLVGNLPTERALSALAGLGVELQPGPGALATSLLLNQDIAHEFGAEAGAHGR